MKKFFGILMDGDFWCSVLIGLGFLEKLVLVFMICVLKMIVEDVLGVDVLWMFEVYKIDDFIVVDYKGWLVGFVDG